MRPGDNVGRNQLTGPLGCGHAGVNRRLHGPNLAPDHNGDVAASNLFLGEKLHVSYLAHGIGGFYGGYQSSGFNHP
jgi:hypothetical protein